MKTNFENILKKINRPHTDELLAWLETHNFYTAPASYNHHNNYKHGLLKHSLEVCNEALYLRSEAIRSNPEIAGRLPKESVAVAALLHDICKWNVFFLSPYTGKVKCNKTSIAEGHGRKSLSILGEVGYPLTEDEMMAIWWHMGKDYEPSYKDCPDEYERSCNSELAVLIRKADYNATHLKERFEEALDSLTGFNVLRLKRYLTEGNCNFYEKNCGSHHHYTTGLVAHSLGTWRHMMQIYTGPDKNEAAAIALLHDIADQNRTTKYDGHGHRSYKILKYRLDFGLSAEALKCILYHKEHRNPSPEEQAVMQTLLWKCLNISDHFDAGHDITDVYRHFKDEIF